MGLSVIIVLIALVAVGAILAARASSRRTALAWQEAALQLGLGFTAPSAFRHPTIQGRIGEMTAEVDTYTQSSGNNSTTYTRYRVRYPTRGYRFRLSRQTGLSRVTKFFGAQDVEVGDAVFDEAFVIKADYPERAAAILGPMVRTTLLRLAASYPGVAISDESIEYSKRGVDRSPESITSTMRRMIGAGYVVAGLGATTEDLDKALAARGQGDLGRAAEGIRDVAAAHPEDLETRMLEAETLAEAGATDEAAQRFDDLAEQLPTDPDVAGWQERLQQAAPSPSETRQHSPIDAEQFAADLFSGSDLSFETSKRFDAGFKGRPVRWTGSVKSIRSYDSDSDLGKGPGTKAVITIAHIDHDLYGQADLDAVVGLPAGTDTNIARHEIVTFEGTLDRIDSMMRNVFVSNGRLV